MKKITLGIIGLGTVGVGVFKMLQEVENVYVKKIAVKNIEKKREIENFDYSILTNDAFEIVNDPEIDIVIEVAGAVEPVFCLIKKALQNGKHVVTANKELLAKKFNELFELANEHCVTILHEAAIAAAIPIIMPLKMTLCANKIKKIEGILNGTTNYILTKMTEESISYEKALKDAQKLGYAETDPTNDVMGLDAAFKICILATIAFRKCININKIYKEGITKITSEDIQYAKELGFTIKLVAQANFDEKSNKTDIRVHPVFVKTENVLSKIQNATNAILLEGSACKEVCFIGEGAGEMPTASSVVGDILILKSYLENEKTPELGLMMKNVYENAIQKDILDTENEYYILIEAKNSKGTIGTIGSICAQNNISLAIVLQKGIQTDNTAKIVVITSKALEKDVQNAVSELEKNESIIKVQSLIRVLN